MDTIWQPLGDGISYYQAKGGIVYRSHEGHLTFAPDPDTYAKALEASVERVVRKAINGELTDREAVARQAAEIQAALEKSAARRKDYESSAPASYLADERSGS